MMLKLLLAEDTKDVGELLVVMLEDAGYAVDWVDNGDEALKRLQSGNSYNLLITDIAMPGKSGYDLLSSLNKSGSSMPVIVLSGAGISREDRDKFEELEKNAATVLYKPINTRKLFDSITALSLKNAV